MKFIKYNDIENSYRQKFIDKIIFEEKVGGTWIVTEKIHGANFSFWYDGRIARMAKRTSFIGDGQCFYGIQQLEEDLIERTKRLYDWIRETRRAAHKRNPEYIVIYGELFGGTYPHPEVQVVPRAKKVQKKVYYCPQNDFVVYDIKVDGQFVNFDKIQEFCNVVRFKCVEILFSGTFEECAKYNNEFLSTIYKRYGLPPIENNICEGIVIRPIETRFLYDRSRVMLKSKNVRFTEKERKPKKEWVKVELSAEGEKAIEEMSSMVTDNRYDAVVSKIGEITLADFGKLQGEMMKDVVGEFMKDTKAYFDYNNLEKVERKLINKMVSKEIANLIRRRLLIEG